jgi:WD40 repeat protein
MRRLALSILMLSLLAVPATANAATAGGLKMLSGTAGCFSDEDPVAAGCSDGRALAGVGDVVVSPDGKNVYVSSTTDNAIAIFDRNTSTGRLTQKSGILGCITVTGATATNESCNLIAPPDPAVLTNPTAMAISGDGKSLYVVSNQGRLGSFNRASDGGLTFNDSSNLCGNGCALGAVAVSPDGANVYPAGAGSNGIIAIYRRNTTAGATLGDIGSGFRTCFSVSTCGQSATNLGTISEVVVTPDNKQVLLAIQNQNLVLAWDRMTSGANVGDVTPTTATDHCVSNGGVGSCQTRGGIITPQSLAVTDGGKSVLVGSQQSLVTLGRTASTGALTPPAGNCVGYPTNPFSGCSATPGASCCTTFYQAREVTATPDGKEAYFGTESSNPTIWGFSRPGGNLSLIPPPLRCMSVTAADTCGTFKAGNRIQEMDAAPGNTNVYAGGNNRVWAFGIDRPPVCSNVSASTVNTTSVRVTFNCSDPDGDALTYQKVSDPSRGTLAGVSGNGVNYGPQPGTSGTDSFTYRAIGAGVPSDPATAFVNVSAPSGGGGGGGGTTPPPPLTVVPSTTSINSLAFPKFTKLVNLSAKNLQAGSTVLVTCKTKKKKQQKKGCPYKSKRFTTSGARESLNLRKPFKKKKVPVGTKIAITITAPGFLGKRITYTIRARKLPKSRVQCLSATGKVGSCA